MKKIFFIICILTTIFAVCSCDDTPAAESSQMNENLVIYGAKSNITVYADDSADVINAAVLDGVYVQGDDTETVKYKIISKQDSSEISSLSAGEYNILYYCENADIEEVIASLTVLRADTIPPVFEGVKDITVYLGSTPSYRNGVTVTDETDKNVQFTVDASQVDLTKLGEYKVVYSASDARGNTATATATVTVLQPLDNDPNEQPTVTKHQLDQLCKSILDRILKDGMTDREKAEAIYKKVSGMKYVNTADDSDWMVNAYNGLSAMRGDCVNYADAARALLTTAGIPNYGLERVGGTSDHFWLIVYIDGEWYHFDACPTSLLYPYRCFLRTDSEVKEYSDSRTDKPNYYNYDKENCPYDVKD